MSDLTTTRRATYLMVAVSCLTGLACVSTNAADPGAGAGAGGGAGSTEQRDDAGGAVDRPGAGGTTTGGGGTTGAGGLRGAGGSGAGGSPAVSCGSATLNQHPFGCKFAFGIANPGGSLASFASYLQFASMWVGTEVKADGSINSCGACNWLSGQVASSTMIPVFYAYFIGYYGHANNLPDGNQTTGQSLTTGGAALIKANRAKIIQMYTYYAREVAKVWPTKPLVWLLEGDFVQYTGTTQSSPLTYAELGQLAADITCAIKSNMPNAVVAIDHSSWNSDQVTNDFWNAMAVASYDMVWTTGVGNNGGYLDSKTTSTTYNHATATYAYLHNLTKRTILVDTSAGISAQGDSWSTASVADLDARARDGVIAANITGTRPANLQTNVTNLVSSAAALPSCP